MPESPVTCVWYVELKGKDALSLLALVLDVLPEQAGFQGAELLTSPAQPELILLASRWAGEIPDLPLPHGAKHWTFQVAAALP